MKNAVAYLRVSTKGQVEKFGLDSQREMIEKYASEHDIVVREWYIEKGESGAKESRPEFDRLIYGDEIMNPPVEMVIVAKSDRVARDMYIYYAFKHELQKKDIELVSVTEDFGAMGQFAPIMEAMLVAMGQVERVTIKARTSGGRKTKAYSGGYSGGNTPYGYEIVNHELSIREDEAAVVREIYDLREHGFSLRSIVTLLESKGYTSRNGKPFSLGTVNSILNNREVYEGKYRYGDMEEYTEGRHEAILE